MLKLSRFYLRYKILVHDSKEQPADKAFSSQSVNSSMSVVLWLCSLLLPLHVDIVAADRVTPPELLVILVQLIYADLCTCSCSLITNALLITAYKTIASYVIIDLINTVQKDRNFDAWVPTYSQ